MKSAPLDAQGKPMLSRTQVCEIMGVSRKALRYYDETGVCSPAHIDENSRYKYYSVSQIPSLMLVKLVSDMGVPIASIRAVMQRGPHDGIGYEELFRQAWRAELDDMRHIRRALKDASLCREAVRDMAAVGQRDDWYLRYIPQRWCAVMAIGGQEPRALGRDEAARLYSQLRKSAAAYGWSSTFLSGSLFSTGLDGQQQAEAGYLYIELASPAMPEPTGAAIIDSGCYRPAGVISDNCRACTEDDCATCGRLGLGELPEDLAPRESGRPYLLTEDDLKQPYLSGIWAAYTRNMLRKRGVKLPSLEEQARREHDDALLLYPEPAEDAAGSPASRTAASHAAHRDPSRYVATPARRPMLMPLPALLPGAVSAAILPAGVYLCKQHPGHDDPQDTQSLMMDLDMDPAA